MRDSPEDEPAPASPEAVPHEEESQLLIHVDNQWRLAADFVPTKALTNAAEAGAPAKLCDISDAHSIVACPNLHSLDQKVLVSREPIRLRTLDHASRIFQQLLVNPKQKVELCTNKGPHNPMKCNFVHLVPHFTVGVERIPRTELLFNPAYAHLLEFPMHRGRWCTNSAAHDAHGCNFVHWKAGAPKKPPRRPGLKSISASPTRAKSAPLTEEEEDALLAAYESSSGKKNGDDPTDESRMSTAETTTMAVHDADSSAVAASNYSSGKPPKSSFVSDEEPRHGAGTVVTMADVLPRSLFAKLVVAIIFLVISWLFAS
jgi:hypothetical protein